jgi:hypothetical protein
MGRVRVVDANTLRLVAALEATKIELKALCWSPDSRRIACAGLDNTVRVWDLATRQITATLRGHRDWVMGVSWSPDGQRLASASNDATIKIWNPDREQETATLRGHTDRVNSVSWSPDGQRLASASWDQTIRVWDATRGYTAERSPALLPGLEQRLAARPHTAEELHVRGAIHARLGQWDEAASDWNRASRLRTGTTLQHFEADWWVLGPFATSAADMPPSDTEPDPFQPARNLTAIAPVATPRQWLAAPATGTGWLNLSRLFPRARTGSARALLPVYALSEQTVTALIAATGSYQLELNGRIVHQTPMVRPPRIDDDRVSMKLRAGWNSVLVQVDLGKDFDWLTFTFE